MDSSKIFFLKMFSKFGQLVTTCLFLEASKRWQIPDYIMHLVM
jgi:hypothetical protein